jgi:hypothetical protein
VKTAAVIIPTLDASSDLRRSLQSVSQQTLPADQIIVVANGDRTATVAKTVREWTEISPEPRVVDIGNPPNVARALNVGIEAAHAKYIVRLDAGDWAYPNRIATQLRAMEEGNLDLVASGYDAVTPQGVKVPNLRGSLPPDSDAIIWHLLVQNCIAHPTVVLRRESALRAGLYDENLLLEDYDLWLREIRRWKMQLLDVPLIQYSYSRHSRTREVKAEGTRQLLDRYVYAWKAIAAIDISADAASRLLAPELRPIKGGQGLSSSLEAMRALNELELRASVELAPARFSELRERVAVSRLELIATTAFGDPISALRLVALIPPGAIVPASKASFNISRFVWRRRRSEFRQRPR